MGVMWPKTLCVLNPPPGAGGGSQQDRHKGVASVWDLLIPVSLRSHSWGGSAPPQEIYRKWGFILVLSVSPGI